MSYTVKVEVFEGPLDLLLHLIEKNRINIYDIPIAEISQQYLDYLTTWQEFNIDLASEFLVMAATLMEIKTRALFPRRVAVTPEGEEEADPRAELVERLLEYRRYKEVLTSLQELERQQALRYPRGSFPETAPTIPILPTEGLSVDDLFRAFLALVEEPVREIELEEKSLQERLREVLWFVTRHSEGISFRRLLGPRPSRPDLILTFLAVLELLRQRKLLLRQERPFGEIYLSLGDGGKTWHDPSGTR